MTLLCMCVQIGRESTYERAYTILLKTMLFCKQQYIGSSIYSINSKYVRLSHLSSRVTRFERVLFKLFLAADVAAFTAVLLLDGAAFANLEEGRAGECECGCRLMWP